MIEISNIIHKKVHYFIFIPIIRFAISECCFEIGKTVCPVLKIDIDSGYTGLLLELSKNGPEPRIVNIVNIEHNILFGMLFIHQIRQQCALLLQQGPRWGVLVQFCADVQFQVIWQRFQLEMLGRFYLC